MPIAALLPARPALLIGSHHPVCPTISDAKLVPFPRPFRAFISGLRNNLMALLVGGASPSQVKSIVRVCHANAEGILARRVHLGHLLKVHGLSLSDLAFDCICDLFARDEQGRYKTLESYFSAYDISSFSDEEIYFHLQRLSFTRVRNGLFRLYSEMDPQLARILHNIKIASRALGLFNDIDRLGESCLAPALSDTFEHLPPAEVSDLTAWLSGEASGNEFIPELLGKLCMSLRKQTTFSRVVPIVTIGLAIRAFYKQQDIPQLGEPVTVIDEGAIDAAGAIAEACNVIRGRTYGKYVNSGKVTEEMFDLYFRVIARMLELRFISHDGAGFQLSESFLMLMPGVGLQEYRKTHRNRLEYLARLVQKRVSKALQP